MEVIVKIDNLVGSGPFKITWAGYLQGETHMSPNGTQNSTPLVESVERWQLLSGFTFTVSDGITKIRVSEISPCENFVDIDILSEPGDAIVADPDYNIKIIGSAIPVQGGYTMVRNDLYTYTITGAFVNGNAQFDVDGGIYGGTTFPTGTAVDDVSLQIPVVAGNYKVTLDVSTGDYSFIVV
jgi:hypothetical protein